MSIQTDLTRIKNAKSAIKAAIEGKGVTVPDGTLLDGMASLIESIETGGGGIGGLSGDFVPSEDMTSAYLCSLDQSFESRPKVLVVFRIDYDDAGATKPSNKGFQFLLGYIHSIYNRSTGLVCYANNNGRYGTGYANKTGIYAAGNEVSIFPYSVSSSAKLLAGIQYRWIALY